MRYLIILTIFISSCITKETDVNLSPNGFWEQDGYGKIIEIKDSIIRVFDICAIDCHLAFEEEILDFGRIKEVKENALVIKHNIDDWKFKRIKELPEICLNTLKDKSKNPIYNFDVFWNTFNEHYCSFDIKGIDWKGMYDLYRTEISEGTTELELYQVFREMTDELDDGHIGFDIPSEIEDAYNESSTKEKKRYSMLDLFEVNKEIAELYMDSVRNYNGGFVRWGMVGEEIGYIQFNAMWMIGNYNIAPSLGLMETYGEYKKEKDKIKDEETRDDEERGANYIMNTILADLPNAKSYILDLRFNGGGKDNVAMQIMNRFGTEKKKVASKHVRYKKSTTAFQDIYVNPSAHNFSGKLIVLTSQLTASAAELAVLASLSNPNTKRIGSKTEGIFSSTLDKTLPNGWSYELSNEIYVDLNNTNYENKGIPADILIDYPASRDLFIDQLKDAIGKGKDEAIEKAIKEL